MGMHARLAYSLADICSKFDCEISVEYGGSKADAKSMREILELGAGPGETITLETSEIASESALKELLRFFGAEGKTL